MATVAKKRSKYLERLYQLLRVMEEVRDNPCKSFSWYDWGTKYFKEAKKGINPNDAPSFCGTQACVAGWASLDPWFRRRGFSSRWFGNNADGCSELFLDIDELGGFFGLDNVEEDRLFYGSGGVKKAISVIKVLIKKKEKEEKSAKAAS